MAARLCRAYFATLAAGTGGAPGFRIASNRASAARSGCVNNPALAGSRSQCGDIGGILRARGSRPMAASRRALIEDCDGNAGDAEANDCEDYSDHCCAPLFRRVVSVTL